MHNNLKMKQKGPFIIELSNIPKIKEVRIPRKIKKRIKKSRYNVFKIKCWKDSLTKRYFFDIFFTINIKELHDLQH